MAMFRAGTSVQVSILAETGKKAYLLLLWELRDAPPPAGITISCYSQLAWRGNCPEHLSPGYYHRASGPATESGE